MKRGLQCEFCFEIIPLKILGDVQFAQSYLRNWVGLQEEFYPHAGWGAELYSAELDHTDLASIERLFTGLQVRYNVNIYSGSTLCLTRPLYKAYIIQELERAGGVLSGMDCWWPELVTFAADSRNLTWQQLNSSQDFSMVCSV